MTEFTADQVSDLVKGAVTEAIKAINPPAPDARPPAPFSVPAFIGRLHRPSIGKAIYAALAAKSWTGFELERDLVQATKELFGQDFGANSVAFPTSVDAYASVLEATAIKTPASDFGQFAVKAMGEGTNSVTISGAGSLVPVQFLQDEFVLALTSAVALRSVPEVETIPVNSNVVFIPRESTVATTTNAAEAGTLTSADPTFSNQSITIMKQYGYRTFSNELLRDSNPAIDRYVITTLARDLGLRQDFEYLEGAGGGSTITGIRNYSGLTTSSWVAGTNGSTPGADDLIKMVFDIYKANANPSAWVLHPRTLQNIVTLKDASGRYIFTDAAVWGGPVVNPASIPGAGSYPSKAVGRLLGSPVYLSTQVLTNETKGSSSLASHIIYGDFRFCKILERAAAEITMSEHIAFNTDQTAVRAIGRSALVLTQPTAFAVATGII